MVYRGSTNTISNNRCIDNNEGIVLRVRTANRNWEFLQYSEYYDIKLEDSPFGNGADNNLIQNNTCTDGEGVGIYVNNSDSNQIRENTVTYKVGTNGIELYYSANNLIRNNTLDHIVGLFSAGIDIRSTNYPSNNNVIYLNNFSDNTANIASEGSTNSLASPAEITYTYQSQVFSGFLGNYYKDYAGQDDGSGGRSRTEWAIGIP
jgi:parallel beta-helix repeat protein